MRVHDIIWQPPAGVTAARVTGVWPAGPPKLWASQQALNALHMRGDIMAVSEQGGITFQHGAQGQQKAATKWIFVPSYRRFSISDPKQMLVDWSDAMKDMSYTRVIVVRPGEEQKASVFCA